MKKVREGYKMTEIGEIPVGWKVNKLSEIADINPRKEIANDNTIVSFIAMEDISNSGRVINKNDKLYEEVKKGYTGFKNNDVLLAKITPCFENGKRALVKDLSNNIGFGSTEFHVLRETGESIAKYIYYVISSHRFRNKAESNMTGSAGQKRVPTEFIKDYITSVPSIEEQEKIASILSTVDEQIDNVDGLIEKNKELKKGLMQQLLTKGIGHTKFKETEIGEIPEEWEIKKLDEVCTRIIDGNYGGKYPKNDEFLEYGVPFLTSTVIGDNNRINSNDFKYISTDKHLELKKAHTYARDIILTNRGAKVGAIAIIPDIYEEINIGPQLTKMTSGSNIFYKYLYYVLQGDVLQKVINSNNSGSAMNFMSLSTIKNLEIPLPSVQEQEKIASILFEVDEKIEEYENKKQKLEELKKGLMQQLLTGKIRV